MDKKYYWLKLPKDFFRSKRIKKLRSLAGGDTFTIIYFKMQLLSLDTDGILEYTGLEESFAKELALDLDESPDNVQITVNYLLSCGLLEEKNEREYFLPFVESNTQSETKWAEKKRLYRASRTIEGQCPIEIEKEIEIEKDIYISPQNDEGFDAFWEAYPKKKSKKDALKAWKKLNPGKELTEKILQAVETQKQSIQWQKDNGQYIPYPASWLNSGAWDDEVEVKKEVYY